MTLHLHMHNQGLISCCEYYLAYQPLQNIASAHCVHIAAKMRQGLPPSPDSVESYVLNRACCSGWQTTAGKETEKGGNEKTEKQGRRGRERYSSKSIEAWQIQWRNPPSSQMNISACLPPPLLSSPPPSPVLGFFIPSSSLGPLHYSLACSKSRAHSYSCCFSPSTEPLSPAFTFPPSDPGHGDSELALFCCWDGEWASIKLLS